MRKYVVIYGTRPELIKLVPIILELRKNKKIKTIIINTGQHKELLIQLESFFNIKPDFRLELMEVNQSLNKTLSKVFLNLERLLSKIKPEIVIVQGDTSTVLGSSVVCFNMGIKIAHVEAGLRSFNLNEPFPEEFNRKTVSLIADYNFAPTKIAANNLQNEKVDKNKIYVTGNTIVDSIKLISKKIKLNKLNSNQILITAHRRENHGIGIENICKAVKLILKYDKKINFIWPIHPNPNVKKIVERELKNIDQVQIIEPLDYFDMLKLIKSSKLIWTDSGGIQEECPYFKKPVLILRNVTERPEVVNSGFGIITGTNPESIYLNTIKIISNNKFYKKITSGKNPFGDGTASKQIVKILTS